MSEEMKCFGFKIWLAFLLIMVVLSLILIVAAITQHQFLWAIVYLIPLVVNFYIHKTEKHRYLRVSIERGWIIFD